MKMGNGTQEQLFSTYCVGAIISRMINGVEHILLQKRYKGVDSPETGLIEVPCAKIRVGGSVYDVIRNKVKLETGLTVTEISGEALANRLSYNGYEVVSFPSFYSAQNLNDNYSIAMGFFVCGTEGEHLPHTSESYDIGWVNTARVLEMVNGSPELFYPMVVDALRKYCKKSEMPC